MSNFERLFPVTVAQVADLRNAVRGALGEKAWTRALEQNPEIIDAVTALVIHQHQELEEWMAGARFAKQELRDARAELDALRSTAAYARDLTDRRNPDCDPNAAHDVLADALSASSPKATPETCEVCGKPKGHP